MTRGSGSGHAGGNTRSRSPTSQGRKRRRSRSRSRSSSDTTRSRAASYAPLARCLARLEKLRARRRRKHTHRWTKRLVRRLARMPGLDGHPGAVRFVALSDTHCYHELVDLPEGEVLLHVGDFTGNYGRSSDLQRHFEQFLSWLDVQKNRFAHIFFIAGNHETFLDSRNGDEASVAEGFEQLRRFLADSPSCTYLDHSSATYRGIRLFGSPVTVSRQETEGKRYYSRAFERPKQEREELWTKLPEGLDVLMTHCPPRGRLSKHKISDSALADRLATMTEPPRYHVFGHDHDHLGVDADDQTVFLNVAQDEYLRLDPRGGGCPLIFDVEARE